MYNNHVHSKDKNSMLLESQEISLDHSLLGVSINETPLVLETYHSRGGGHLPSILQIPSYSEVAEIYAIN